MENRLAEVVDKTVIMEVDTELSLCSCENDVVDETCSLGGDDTRRSRMLSTKEGFVEILEFTHFAKHFMFTSEGEKIRNKHLKNYFDVSVVVDIGCGNTNGK